MLPSTDTVLQEGDRVLVVTSRKDIDTVEAMIGRRESIDWNRENVDWNAIDSQLVSRRIIITRPEINGKRLGALRLRNSYGINISRIYRSGMALLATPDLMLQMGAKSVVSNKSSQLSTKTASKTSKRQTPSARNTVSILIKHAKKHNPSVLKMPNGPM